MKLVACGAASISIDNHEPVYCKANDIVYLSLPIDRDVPKSGREMLDNEVKLGNMASQVAPPRPRWQASAEDLPARTRGRHLANLISLGYRQLWNDNWSDVGVCLSFGKDRISANRLIL